MVMSEGPALPSGQMQNGHQGDPPTRPTLSGAEDALGPPSGRAETLGDGSGREEGQKADWGRRRSDPGRPHRGVSAPYAEAPPEESVRGQSPSPSIQAGDHEDLLSRARSQAESLGAQVRAGAEDLLSRAQSQAELLQVHAENIRAEADALRAEAAALGRAVSHHADAAGSSAESVADEERVAAEGIRSAIRQELDAARQEFEWMRAEAILVRRVLRAEIDAGVGDVDRVRGDVQRLCAETNKLAAELGLLFAAGGLAQTGMGGEAGGRPPDVRRANEPGRVRPTPAQPQSGVYDPAVATDHAGQDGPPAYVAARDIRSVRQDTTEAHGPSDDPVASGSSPNEDQGQKAGPPPWTPDGEEAETGRRPEATGAHADSNLAELLREIWDAASAGLGRLSEDPPSGTAGCRTDDHPTGTPGSGPSETREGESNASRAQASVEPPSREDQIFSTVSGLRGSEPLIGSGGWRAMQAARSDAAPEGGEAITPPPSPSRRRRFHRG